MEGSGSKSEPGDALFDNKYAKILLEEIKIAWNGDSQAYDKSKKKFLGFIPHFLAPFNMEIATSMLELIDNLVHFYIVLVKTSDFASILYQHEVLADRLSALKKDHLDIKKYLKVVVLEHKREKNSPLLNFIKILKPLKPARQVYEAALKIVTFCTVSGQNVLFFCTI